MKTANTTAGGTIEEGTRTRFNTLKKYYDQTWDSENHTLHVGVFEKPEDSLVDSYRQATNLLIQKVCAQLPITETSRILDVGCGAGRTIIEVCQRFSCSGVGIDLSDEQIADAEKHLGDINTQRIRDGLFPLDVKFIRCSGSELEKELKKDEIFSHIISQDAILMVANKLSLFQNISRLLQPGGVVGITDFLSEMEEDSLNANEHDSIFKFVNWTNGLSFEIYKKLIDEVGLKLIDAEKRDEDMIRTYAELAWEMEAFVDESDLTYGQLKERYESIVTAVRTGKMGWANFVATKAKRKVALLAGTKETSIGRFAAKALHEKGYEIWLYSRSAEKIDDGHWHERSCDISSQESIQKLLEEIPQIDLSVLLADNGGGKGELSDLQVSELTDFLNAKILGSLFLCKQLAGKATAGNKMRLIWCAGKPDKKEKILISYGIVNAGIAALVEGLNEHYSDIFKCYYLKTPLISPSTQGDKYIAKYGRHLQAMAKDPWVVVERIVKIAESNYEPGFVETTEDVL